MTIERHDAASSSGTLVSRRRVLGALGVGAATVAVVGAAGLTWYTVDRGVFGTGSGPGYAAWDDWNSDGDRLENLVGAAVLAASAHNTQPWLFRVASERIDLFADGGRTIGALDPLRREMHISLGCAVENLTLAAAPHGHAATVTLMPDPADMRHVAQVDLAPAPVSVSPLFSAIPRRHTNRAAFDIARPVSQAQLDTLASLVDAADLEVVWFTRPEDRTAFADLTVRATQAIIDDRQQADDDLAWYRTDWHDIQAKQDGVTIDASGQPPLIRALAKLLPVSRAQNHDGWLRATRDTQLPTAAAFGAVLVRDPQDVALRLATGRVWQRMHLTATLDGLAMQPLCQVPERIDRERAAGLAPRFTTALARLLPAGWHALMTFRVGYPTAEPLRSPRRPARAVLLP